MAVIENRGPLQWRALVRRKGFPAFSRTFERARDAQVWATELEAAIGRRDLAQVRHLTDSLEVGLRTIADLVDKYLAEVVAQAGRRQGQVASERPRLARIRDELGRLTVEMITTADVARWKDRRLKLASAQTVVHDLNQLSVLLRIARAQWGVNVVNVVTGMEKPKVGNGRDRRVSEEELSWLRVEAGLPPPGGGRMAGVGMTEMITLAVETSMRLGELLSLEWRHIDLDRKVAYLTKTKNGDSRSVALSAVAVEVLGELAKLRSDGQIFRWETSSGFSGSFASLVGRARARFEREVMAGNLPPSEHFLSDLRFHDLRHEATSRLFEKGLNPMEVSSMTGHKSMQMLKRYTHVEAAKVAAKLG